MASQKVRLQKELTALQVERAAAAATYSAELARMDGQIAKVEAILVAWTAAVDVSVEQLMTAGAIVRVKAPEGTEPA